MKKFDVLEGVAASLPLINVDTDMIIPKQFLKSPKRTGYGPALFYELRFNPDGSERADFVLNKEGYRDARLLVVGENFGCGSSREHAPWAVSQFGIRCIIAPSFADIFENNCFQNSILPIRLEKHVVEEIGRLVLDPALSSIKVSLPEQMIYLASGAQIPFEIDSYRKQNLLQGLDSIGITLKYEKEIYKFELGHWFDNAWLSPTVIRESTVKERNR